MKKVVHIIPDEKFTADYIDYMLENCSLGFKHFFYIIQTNVPKEKKEYNNVHGKCKYLKYSHDLLEDDILEVLRGADKIIVSGIFHRVDVALLRLPSDILRKTYLHFWGGDFYSYRNTRAFSKKNIRRIMLQRCINRCAGIITLVPGDYDQLSSIFPNDRPHYVAAMPEKSYDDTSNALLSSGRVGNRILLGNSATKENCHLEVLHLLKHLKGDDICIVCPLSYGDKDYAQMVISEGKTIFGNRFCPITDFLDYHHYMKMLSSCSVGIFANNRQQAMGNIGMMTLMGKKVYLRENTSMWDSYVVDYGIKMYSLSELDNITLGALFSYSEQIAKKNNSLLRKRYDDYVGNWSIILNI